MLKPEDYLETACPFCTDGLDGKKPVHPIDVGRMLAKLDEHLGRNHYAAAAKHLDFWLAEAEYNNDDRGVLAVLGEKMGLHRKRGQKRLALRSAERALALVDAMKLQNTLTGGTTYLNAATVYKAFGRAADAILLYERAEAIYNATLPEGDVQFGGLYNNFALALTDEKRYREAESYYRRAIAVMERAEHGEPELAITYLNMADLAEKELGILDSEALVAAYLDKAEALFDTPGLPHTPYYAFVCEKCASSFDYFGRFAYAGELKERARKIYERA